MNAERQSQLLARLDQSEDPWVERKQSFSEREVRKTLVAFANSVQEGETGVLFIGANNDGKHAGLADADDTQKKVRGQAMKCYPPITYQPVVLPVTVDGQAREVLAVVVPFSTSRPHFSGAAYVREGSESLEASADVFKELVSSQNDKARRLLQCKGQRVKLRFRSESGFWYDLDAVIDACDAITLSLREECHLWSFPISEVEIYQERPFFLVITVRPRWTEEEHIRRIILHWAGPSWARREASINLDRNHPLVAQLLANPARVMAAVKAEADGTENMALKRLHIDLRFELRKIENHMSREEKLKRLEIQYRERLKKGVFISSTDVLSAAVSAVSGVVTSISEAEEFMKILTRSDPRLAQVPVEAQSKALLSELGFR